MTTVKASPSSSTLDRAWAAADAADLYRFAAWGKGYFAVNDAGHVVVRPEKTAGPEIDVLEVVEHLRDRGFDSPLLLRFSDLLAHRLREVRSAFATAMAENHYRGRFLGVYPLKANQQRLVVEEITRYGAELGFGLEVGSKPELLAVMGIVDDVAPRLIVCNGFKDWDYIRSVLLAAKMGRPILPVIEKPDELDLILSSARAEGVRLSLGVRVKLASQGDGRWRHSAGSRSKYGLSVSEVLDLFGRLRRAGLEECLELVHCHVGSQLQDIRRIKQAVGELAHVYAELVRMGATGLRFLDVGGGHGVDYSGSQTASPWSMNYSLREYASEVVYRVAQVCDRKRVPHPTIVTESGRALAAYQSLLVTDVLGRSGPDSHEVNEDLDGMLEDRDLARPIVDLLEAYHGLSEERILECYHDLLEAHDQVQQLFRLGHLSLEQRGFAERLFWVTCARIRSLARQMAVPPRELERLETLLADTYFCNFSLFQSLPDCWALEQIFPVAPIHRLCERPTREATLADISCDSDGRIDRFVDAEGIRRTLPVHELADDAGCESTSYYLAIFLVGVYQEALGNLHNLFGDTHVAHVTLDGEGGWRVKEVIRGDTSSEVLSCFQYDASRLLPRLRLACRRAVEQGRLTETEGQTAMAFYESELESYTYLRSRSQGPVSVLSLVPDREGD